MEWPTFSGDSAAICSQVFAWAMRNFVYVPDEEQRSGFEHWPAPTEIELSFAQHGAVHDDCDGFTAMCRHALKLNGVRSRFVACQTETGGWHAVCEADGLVLDCRQVSVTPTQDLERIGYRWSKMSGYETGDDWTTVVYPTG